MITAKDPTAAAAEAAKAAIEAALEAVGECGSTTFTKTYMNPVADMLKAAFVSALETVIRASQETESKLNARIDQLSKDLNKATSTPTTSFASVLQGKSTEKVQQRHQLVNLVAAENKVRQDRASNVIIVGLPKSSTREDKDSVNEFFAACGLENVAITHVRRIASSKKETVAPSNIVQVVLSSEKEHAAVLQKCNFHQNEHIRGVFAREDRTPAQQAEFNELRAKLKKHNDELAAAALLDLPFRFVAHRRTGEICCINVVKSREQCRYVFASAASALAIHRNRSSATSDAGVAAATA